MCYNKIMTSSEVFEMERSKLKLLRVLDILKETDEQNPITTNEIVKNLKLYGIEAERKSVLRDIATLTDYGYDILLHPDNKLGYYISSRDFEDWEVKVLCDAAMGSRFLTKSDKDKLIKKISSLSSKMGKSLLQRTTLTTSSSINDSNQTKIYIDKIITAIKLGKKVEFKYVKTNVKLEKEYKRDGWVYLVNPYSLIWKDDKYYLIGNYDKYDDLSFYRLDKIRDLVICEDEAKSLSEVLDKDEKRKLAEYIEKTIYTYSGETVSLTLKTYDYMIDDLVDYFGKNIHIQEKEDYLLVSVQTVLSKGLYYWLMQFGEHITVISPEEVRVEFKRRLGIVYRNYKEKEND